jgi:hypothetical protein
MQHLDTIFPLRAETSSNPALIQRLRNLVAAVWSLVSLLRGALLPIPRVSGPHVAGRRRTIVAGQPGPGAARWLVERRPDSHHRDGSAGWHLSHPQLQAHKPFCSSAGPSLANLVAKDVHRAGIGRDSPGTIDGASAVEIGFQGRRLDSSRPHPSSMAEPGEQPSG